MGLRNLTAARARALANNTRLCRPDQSSLEIMNWRVRATTPEPCACHICTGYLRSLFNWKDSSRRLFCQTRAERRKPGSLREAERLCLFSPFDGSTPLFFHPRTQPAGRPIPSALQLLVATVTSPLRWLANAGDARGLFVFICHREFSNKGSVNGYFSQQEHLSRQQKNQERRQSVRNLRRTTLRATLKEA